MGRDHLQAARVEPIEERMNAEISIRPAVAADTARVLSITRDVWEGSDYVPFAWPRWLSDPNGFIFVAQVGRTVAGFQHMAIHDDNSAWLEGIRVAEEFRGRGVARALLDHAMQLSRELGLSAVRLSTWSINEASRRLAEGAGMHLAEKFRSRSAPPAAQPDGVDQVRRALPSDLDRVAQIVQSSGQTFYTEGWTMHKLDRPRLALLLATASVVLAGPGDDAMLICTASPQRPYLRLGFLAGGEPAADALCRWTRAQAADSARGGVRAVVVAEDNSLAALEKAGFPADGDNEVHLWEKRL